MSMAALISTVTNRSRRVTYQDVISASVVNSNAIYDPAIELFTPQEIAAAHVANVATLYAASAEIYEPIEVIAAYHTNAPTLYAATAENLIPPLPITELVAAYVVNSNTIDAARVRNVANPVPAYANYMGTGDRRLSDLSFETSPTAQLLDLHLIIDGVNGIAYFTSAGSGVSWLYEFPYPVLITEARSLRNGTGTSGVWRWQGSLDGSAWVDIGSTFTFGGSTPFLHTQLAGNTGFYPLYRMLWVSGGAGSTADNEMEFKIAANPTAYSFDGSSPYSKGNRSSIITVTLSGMAGGGVGSHIVDGGTSQTVWHTGSGAAFVTLDCLTPIKVRAIKLHRSSNSSGDTTSWRLLASNDNATWTELAPTRLFKQRYITFIFRSNDIAYRYYKYEKTSGTGVNVSYWNKVYFAAYDGTNESLVDPIHEMGAAYVTNAPTVYAATVAKIATLDATAALVSNAPTIYAAEIETFLPPDALWSNVVLIMDTKDHHAAAESQRLRHHSADSNIGQSIPVSNAYYTTAQKLAGRDYSIGGGITSDLTTVFGLDLNAGAFTIEGRVRRSGTGQQLLMHQGPGSSVFRFGFENGTNARLMFSYTTNGVTWINLYSLSAVVSGTHAFKHIAADRGSDNVLRLFVDGVMVAKSTLSYVSPTPIETKLNVGANLTSGGAMFIDDVRVTIGANRYGSDAAFTPPASILRGPSPDAQWSKVVALQRFDARVGATIAALADASRAALYVAAAAGVTAVVDTPHTPTAANSAGGGYIRSKAGAAGSNLSGGALWTIDARARLANVADVAGVACAQETAFTGSPGATDKQWRLGFSSDAKPYFEAQLVGGITFTLASITALTKNVWFDLAADCDGSIVRLYVDGAMVAKGTMSAAIADNAPSTKCLFMFGGAGSGGAGFPGSLDEVRVTRDVARYNLDAGYTPIVGRFSAY